MMLQVAAIIGGIFFLGTLGIFGNLNIVIATYVAKELHSKCGVLIGILAFCDLFCIAFEWLNAIRLLVGEESWRLSCYASITPYIFMINFQTTMILVVSTDRLIAILCPIKYRIIQTRTYVLCIIAPGAVYGISLVIAGYVYMTDGPIEVCNPPLAFPPNVSVVWNKLTISINFLVLFVYLLTILCLKYKVTNVASSGQSYYKRQQAIMRNLSVMILFFFFSWFLAHASVLIVTFFGLGASALHIAQSMAVIPAMLCYSQNFYIYFSRSELYRALFIAQLVAFVRCGKRASPRVYARDALTATSKNVSRVQREGEGGQ